MYDCDKGYILSEKGPVGATCVGGLWRPTELPKCLPGLHPRLRWNRRKRDLQKLRNPKMLHNYARFKREMSKILQPDALIEDPFPVNRQRRFHRTSIRSPNPHHKWHLVAPAIMRFKRSIRQEMYVDTDYALARALRNEYLDQRSRLQEQQQRAYNKYYEKIKQKHRNYISNLLRSTNGHSAISDGPRTETKETPYQRQDYNEQPAKDPFDEINAYSSMTIPLPNINHNINVYAKKNAHDGIANNTFSARNSAQPHNENKHFLSNEPSNDYIVTNLPKKCNRCPEGKNRTNIIEMLRQEITLRKKRILAIKRNHIHNDRFRRVKRSADKTDVSLTSLPQHDDDRDSDSEGTKKLRSKEPCEVSVLYVRDIYAWIILTISFSPS